jgi:SAM-dependent methyltransferase
MDTRKLIEPVLSFPRLYELSQTVLGARRSHTRFMQDFVRAGTTESVLDIGCGVGAGLAHLTAQNRYLGIDIDGSYIERARKKYGHRATFLCSDVIDLDLSKYPRFSCAYAYGVLHHLDDAKAARMFEIVAEHVTDRFVTIDPVIRPEEHPVARYLISRDRGRFVRAPEGYASIARKHGRVESFVLTDLLRFPYSHLVMRVSLRDSNGEASSAVRHEHGAL